MQASLQRVPDGVIGAADGRRMDFGGRIKRRKPSRDRRVSHPLSIGARMMVRVSERAFDNVNLGGIAEAEAFVPCGAEVFFVFKKPVAGNDPSIRRPSKTIFLEVKNMKKNKRKRNRE